MISASFLPPVTAVAERFDATLLPAESGTYILLLESGQYSDVAIGRFATLALQPGWYLYVGSAFGPGGLRARVGRHLRRHKSSRWHIDYLRSRTQLRQIWYCNEKQRRESLWAGELAKMPGLTIPLAGFGASDRRGESHLFYTAACPKAAAFRQRLLKADPCHSPVQTLSLA